MNQENQYMLIFTLGPVQPFIAQARKTRDLWLGSFLFSKLMEAGMEHIDELAETFVFPTERKITGDIPDLPNKYIAIFNSSKAAEQAATRTESQIADKWQKICDEIQEDILGNHYKKEEVKKTWDRQTNFKNLFEVFWVIVEGSQNDYKNWLREALLALDARKHLRDFRPQDEPGEKSTVSGEREALHEKGTSREAMQDFWKKLTSRHSISAKDIGKDGSERLDAIDTVKRFALRSDTFRPSLATGHNRLDFPSTSSIATAPFVAKLLQADIQSTVLRDWDKITSPELVTASPDAIPYLKPRAGEREWMLWRDGDCYFPEAFTPRYLKRNYAITTNDEEKVKEPDLTLKGNSFIPDCLEALDKLLKAVNTHPTPYYALVQMDGDRMSTIINNVSNLDEHQAISAALSKLAREDVPQITQVSHPGRLVYAGGDDVLAFTPLSGMLEMVDALQTRYKEVVRKPVSEEDKEKVTPSMGIAIAHHFTPLSMVRRAALQAEKLAKDRYNRDALVITVIRRSGEQTRVGGHWAYKNPENEAEDIYPITLFKSFYSYFVDDILSPKSIQILLGEASTLVWLDRPEQISEIKRVLKRQRNDQKKDQLSDKQIEGLAKQLVTLATAMDIANKEKRQEDKDTNLSIELHEDKLRYGLVETFGWLLVMEFLAREGQEV